MGVSSRRPEYDAFAALRWPRLLRVAYLLPADWRGSRGAYQRGSGTVGAPHRGDHVPVRPPAAVAGEVPVDQMPDLPAAADPIAGHTDYVVWAKSLMGTLSA